MRFSGLKWVMVFAMLFIASGNAHGHSVMEHAGPQAEQCAHHQPHQAPAGHQDCCCTCLNCPAGLMTPYEANIAHRAAYSVRLTPDRAVPLASRSLSPEPGPPRTEPS